MRSRSEQDAGTRAGKPERPREVGGGTAEVAGVERQSDPARIESTGEETMTLMEEVLRRENVMQAYERVVSNAGAQGQDLEGVEAAELVVADAVDHGHAAAAQDRIDGVTVDDLKAHCWTHWPRPREELLGERYQPQPVRRVEIPKPDG